MLTNDDIHMIKALLYAAHQLPDIPYPPDAFSEQMDYYVKEFLHRVSVTMYTINHR